MLTEYHELDPRGDVQLVLKSHSTPYKIPDDPLLLAERDESPSDLAPFVQHGEGLDEPADAPVEVEEITSIEVSAEAVDIILEPEEVWAATEDALVQDASTEPEASDDVVTLADSNHLDAPRDNSYHGGDTGREGAALAGSVALQGGRETPDDIGSEEMRMRVSSKHLTLASSQFERMFQGDWREGNTLRSAGSLEVPLPGDDPAAMLILMNIIHGRTRKVPRLVDLETLTRLAILIDYYQFHEAVEVFSDMWVDGLKEQLPRAYTKDLVRWICVSWVLRKPREFGQVTRTAQRQAKGVVATYGLPIPDSIVEAINRRRPEALRRVISALQNYLEEYQCDTVHCSLECDTMLLGALTKGMRSIGLLTPPEPPFPGLSFDVLVQNIRKFRFPSVRHHKRCYCEITPRLNATLTNLEDNLCGLDLSDFSTVEDYSG